MSDLGENSKARELEKAFISERFEIYADKLHQSLNETSLMTADEANNYLLLASFMEASEEKKAIALLEKALIGDHLTDWTSTDLASFLHRYKELHEGKLSPELIAYAQVGEAADIGDALEKHGLERVVALFQEGFYGDFSKLLPFLNQDNIAGIFHELSRDNLQQLITQSIVELEKDRLENSDAAPKYQMILDYALGEKNPHPDLVGAAVADSLFQSGELTAVARTYLEKNYHKPVHPDIARWYRELSLIHI